MRTFFAENEGTQVKLTKELLEFVAKAMAAHNRRLDEEMVHKALKPVFQNREKAMIKTIFEEREEIGEARGKAEVGARAVLTVLNAQFGTVPKTVADRMMAMVDPIALDSLTAHAATCQTLDDFVKSFP